MNPGKVAIDTHVIDELMRALVGQEQRPSAFLVYLWLWRETRGRDQAHCEISYQALSDRIGISKSAVQDAVALLQRRRLIQVQRATRTAIPKYAVRRPWK